MSILVAYASRYGSTQEIAERIAVVLRAEGLDVDLQPVTAVRDAARYQAFVIGSAAYMGSWLKEAGEFVRRNADVLRTRPVWLFSSGPTGKETKDAKGRDVLVASEPREFTEFVSLNPRDRRVFFGVLNSKKLRGVHRFFALAPAAERAKIEGDFRDWKLIEEWAGNIATELSRRPIQVG